MFRLSSLWKKSASRADWVPGRPHPITEPGRHAVSDRPLAVPWPDGFRSLLVGMGCFWGAERLFWQIPGVWVTAAGFAGGSTPNPTYYEVCSEGTGHAEVVLVVYDPSVVTLRRLLKTFFEEHDPTQGMRQGNDVGTQYRSCLFLAEQEDRRIAEEVRAAYQARLAGRGLGPVTTTIGGEVPFFHAEDEHQQYLAKKPWGYCGLAGTGVACPVGTGEASA
ncbi:peptide-methionine (S)-S-oxide reductase MsrA [Geminicoccus roseus]|uniref:peptide-methionine (S)-S-oxide reductase MsrA n=1 Tax=Geminicoccus roseus TaxID=404900 RepID=UPI00040BF959|nr:peptide-methionine (S)-S-oxide reductase MsrA [Geminicoccus roseus]